MTVFDTDGLPSIHLKKKKKSSYDFGVHSAPHFPGGVELVPSSRWFSESIVEKTVCTCMQLAEAALMSVLDMTLGTVSASCGEACTPKITVVLPSCWT